MLAKTEPETAEATLGVRMTEVEYDRERALLAQHRKNSSAHWDQELAKLFYRSGWTEERLATKENKSRIWVTCHLRFGNFLNFVSTVTSSEIPIANLTERRFRTYWDRTWTASKGSSDAREPFRDVLRLMEAAGLHEGLHESTAPKGIAKAIAEEFADGKWHYLESIVTATQKSEPEVVNALGYFRDKAKRHTYGVAGCEVKQVGKSRAYRIFSADKTISSAELKEKLGPILKELKIEGRKNMATASPGTVAKLAHRLGLLLEQWTK